MSTVTARIADQIGEIPAKDWDRLANPAAHGFNPFVTHAFLSALEASRSVGDGTSWQPGHLVLERGKEIIGLAPAYMKYDSSGEFVFDHHWADAYHRAGGQYYPKLQVSVPFTPVTGPRLLAGGDRATELLLARSLIAVASEMKVSSLHVTFPTEDQERVATEAGMLRRQDQQFHWVNEGYTCFDDFLGALSSIKRKNLRRERTEALQAGIEIDWVTGSALKELHWDAFWEFYQDTGNRKWGDPPLTRSFFSLLGQTMADKVLLVMAKRAGRYIAGALNLIGSDTLYGRNWGAVEHHPFLHFEVCYYQAIDFALAHRLRKVEAGAQGMHKLARGYMPAPTYSAHWIADSGFRRAIEQYLKTERRDVAHAIAELSARGPFRRSDMENNA